MDRADMTHGLRGRYAEARTLLKRAIAIKEKAYEADHPTLAVSYSNLATVERDLGPREEARKLMRQAFEIWRSRLGIDNAYTQRSVAWLAEHDPDFEIGAG